MKLTLGCRTERHSFRNIGEAQARLTALGIEEAFFVPPPEMLSEMVGSDRLSQIASHPRQADSPVLAFVSSDDEGIRSAVMFHQSHQEVGLWVRPNLRRSGVGMRAFQAALSLQIEISGCYRLLAWIARHSSGDGYAMTSILKHCGFEHVIAMPTGTLWARNQNQSD